MIASLLVLGCMLIVGTNVLEIRAARELEMIRLAMGAQGGGVVIVRSTSDCLGNAGIIELVATGLLDHDIPVKGVVIRDRAIQSALEVANHAFPHEAISGRATTPLYHLGHEHTPLALVIDSGAAVLAVEPIAGRPASTIVDSLVLKQASCILGRGFGLCGSGQGD